MSCSLFSESNPYVTLRSYKNMDHGSVLFSSLTLAPTIGFWSPKLDVMANIKAMLQPRKREGIKVFYFTTNTSSMRVRQFMSDNRACVYFCDSRFFRGVMLRGQMEILTDTESRQMIWRDGDTEYYPGGVSDPDYCVLKFTAMSGRYYSNFVSEEFAVD